MKSYLCRLLFLLWLNIEIGGNREILLQVEAGGKLFWAEPLKEAKFLRAAAGCFMLTLSVVALCCHLMLLLNVL